jgi:hypothetical protein
MLYDFNGIREALNAAIGTKKPIVLTDSFQALKLEDKYIVVIMPKAELCTLLLNRLKEKEIEQLLKAYGKPFVLRFKSKHAEKLKLKMMQSGFAYEWYPGMVETEDKEYSLKEFVEAEEYKFERLDILDDRPGKYYCSFQTEAILLTLPQKDYKKKKLILTDSFKAVSRCRGIKIWFVNTAHNREFLEFKEAYKKSKQINLVNPIYALFEDVKFGRTIELLIPNIISKEIKGDNSCQQLQI